MSETNSNIRNEQEISSSGQGMTGNAQGFAQGGAADPSLMYQTPVAATAGGEAAMTWEEVQPSASKGINISRVAMLIIAIVIVLVIAGVGLGAYFIGQNNNAVGAMPSFAQGELGEMPEGGGNFSGERPEGMGSFAGGMGMDYSMFVDEGIIDQDTADEMEEYMQEYMQNNMPAQAQSTQSTQST